jgi:hypothetical protein
MYKVIEKLLHYNELLKILERELWSVSANQVSMTDMLRNREDDESEVKYTLLQLRTHVMNCNSRIENILDSLDL